jgi:hypothetical protein
LRLQVSLNDEERAMLQHSADSARDVVEAMDRLKAAAY